MTTWTVEPAGPLRGALAVPGDKSVSHRALLFNLLASGPARIRGLLDSQDVACTARAVQALGARLEPDGQGLILHPPRVLVEPHDVIDCGNSGTTMRLLVGLLAAEPIYAVLTGDGSLRRRPMGRIADPLRRMGAHLDGREGGRLAPLGVRGPSSLDVHHRLAIASAQVKTALLLAGRHTGVTVTEPAASRDHSERLLRQMGAPLTADGLTLRLEPVGGLSPVDVVVPGDVSAAAFWLVAASIVPGSRLILRGVGLNPTRTGVIDVLLEMGADVTVHRTQEHPEPLGDVEVRFAELVGTRIDGDLALRALDELPVLAIAAAFASGETTIADARELRVKESDRVARTVAGLRALGVDADERDDGMIIQGGRPRGPARIDATGDHRIAMAFAVAGCVAGPLHIDGAGAVASSYPTFPSDLEALRGA